MIKYILLIVLYTVSIVIGTDSDLYFYVQENVPRCFSEELPGETLIIGDYKHPEAKLKKLNVVIYDSQGKSVLHKPLTEQGRFAYHATEPGEHKTCIESENGAAWPVSSKTAKFHLKIEVQGKDTEIHEDVIKKENIVSLQEEIINLKNEIDLVLEDLNYAKEQEIHFNDQSERVNERVMWWSMLQTSLLLISAYWQVTHLKSFFKAKKLV